MCISEPQPALDRHGLRPGTMLRAALCWSTDEGVVAHALAALRSRLPWHCTVHKNCFTRMYMYMSLVLNTIPSTAINVTGTEYVDVVSLKIHCAKTDM